MLNYEKIFDLFNEEEIMGESPSTSYDELRDHPVFYLGMYKKIINHSPLSNKKIEYILKSKNVQLDKDDVDKAGKYITCNKAWKYIINFNLDDTKHCFALKEFFDEDLSKALDTGIGYFESTTEFEKCAFLKKIKDSALYLQK